MVASFFINLLVYWYVVGIENDKSIFTLSSNYLMINGKQIFTFGFPARAKIER